ncbi:MAG: VanZ family protein [Gemmatimonadota bacterium]
MVPKAETTRRGFLLAWVVLLGLITLVPGGEDSIRTSDPFLCLSCGIRGSADAILNVVLFMPLGFLVAPRRGVRGALAAGLLLSGGIELSQSMLPGRYPTLGDIVWNGSGAVLGAALALRLRRELEPGPGRPTWVATAIAAVLPLIYLGGAGLLLTPLGTDARYYGQWTPDLDFMPVYGGQVLDIETPQGPLPDGPMAQAPDLRLDGPWWFQARIVKGPPPVATAPIASIYDAEKHEIVLLGAHGEDLVWRERTWAAPLGFEVPDRRFLGVLAGAAPGDTLEIGARGDDTRRCLMALGREDCAGGVTPGRTWGMLMFLEGASEGQRRILDVGWMATLLVLVGLVGGSWRRTGLVTVIVVAGVGTIVVSTRLLPLTGPEWAGLVAGILVGVGLRPLFRHVVQIDHRDRVSPVQGRQAGVDPAEAKLP